MAQHNEDSILEGGSWTEYRRLVVQQLANLSRELGETNAKIDSLRNDQLAKIWAEIAVLKFKSGLWGAVSGAVIAVGAVLFGMVKGQ